jgi:hypothetical protein
MKILSLQEAVLIGGVQVCTSSSLRCSMQVSSVV